MIASQHFYIILILACAFLSVIGKKLTLNAAITGSILACLIFIGGGQMSLYLLAAFFILGTAATAWKIDKKEQIGFGTPSIGPRHAGQVFANAGAAGVLGALALVFPDSRSLFQLMIAATFASATSDTLSSELGNVYGRKFYNILSFKNDQKGLDGVISLEGTLFGIAGSFLIAFIFASFNGFSASFYWIALAGIIGNISDSILGASLEKKQLINNDAVNFLNTTMAAAFIWIVYSI